VAAAVVQVVGCGDGGRRTRSDPSLLLQLLYYTTTYCRRRRRRRRRRPTTGENPTLTRGDGGRGGRRLSGRVSVRAPARQNSVAGPPVALPRGRFLNLAGLCGATAADAATLRVRVGPLGACAAAFNTSLGGERRGTRYSVGGGRTDPPWTRCRARWSVASVVRRVCFGKSSAAPYAARTVQTRGRRRPVFIETVAAPAPTDRQTTSTTDFRTTTLPSTPNRHFGL